MTSDKHLIAIAKLIPFQLRKHIIEERLIDLAENVGEPNTPMEYLYDIYKEFVDTANEAGEFNCPKCRAEIIENFKKLKPYLHYH